MTAMITTAIDVNHSRRPKAGSTGSPTFDTAEASALRRWLDGTAARYADLLLTIGHAPRPSREASCG